MDVARQDAEAGGEGGTVVLAEEQSRGRGRFGRSWVSPAGKNLYFTIVLRPAVANLRLLSMIAPLAVCEAVSQQTGLEPEIKWPNDVLLNGHKLSGTLVETDLAGAIVRHSLVGIGVNVNFIVTDMPEIAMIATSLSQELGRDMSRELILVAILNRFDELYRSEPAAVRDAWKSRLETLGRNVAVTFRDRVYQGLAEDVDEDGNLVLRTSDGSRIVLEAGEVSLRA